MEVNILKKVPTPIIDALQKYTDDKIIRFHMPGHKGNNVIHASIRKLLGTKPFRADVTNVQGMDDLHKPQGIIRLAEKLAAETFGADFSYFLINGSSCGLQALVLTICNSGDKILVPRNIHRSVLSGIILSGAIPIFYLPEYNTDYGIFMGTTPEVIRYHLETTPGIKTVLVVSPTYNGITSDIKSITEISQEYGVPVVVDEAHGPHLRFHEGLPTSALEQGAAAVVHGTHKLLSSFTQASMLHVKSNHIDKEKLAAILKLLQSTSTSYILLASLDAARAQMEENGRNLIDDALNISMLLRAEMMNLKGIRTFGPEIIGNWGVAGLDPTKITISFKEYGVSGFWIEEQLRHEYGIQVEMADLFNILLLITFGNTKKDVQSFLHSLEKMLPIIQSAPEESRLNTELAKINVFSSLPEAVASPRDAFFAAKKLVPLEDAAGKICGEAVACYPPGIPIICPGERITSQIVEYLLVIRNLGAHFQSCYNNELSFISVLQ